MKEVRSQVRVGLNLVRMDNELPTSTLIHQRRYRRSFGYFESHKDQQHTKFHTSMDIQNETNLAGTTNAESTEVSNQLLIKLFHLT